MKNENIQITNVNLNKPRRKPTKKKKESSLQRIAIGVVIGLLVLWLWNEFKGDNGSVPPNNSIEKQIEEGRKIQEKEKG